MNKFHIVIIRNKRVLSNHESSKKKTTYLGSIKILPSASHCNSACLRMLQIKMNLITEKSCLITIQESEKTSKTKNR